MEYKLPDKDLLEKRSLEIDKNRDYYNLSKLTYQKDKNKKLIFPMGIDKDKNKYFIDLNHISGMLVSGTTGSGKSMFLNNIIISLLLKNSPSELKFVFIDPRNVEFNNYKDIPHLYRIVLSDKNESISELNNIEEIIKKRKKLFEEKNFDDIENYNKKNDEKLAHFIIIIDEASELLEDEKMFEILQNFLPDGYKYGIHLILSTSSYFEKYFDKKSINIFKYILSFDLASEEQANFIKLEGSNLLTISGEALIKCKDDSIIDVQTPYVSEHDIKEIVNFIKKQN